MQRGPDEWIQEAKELVRDNPGITVARIAEILDLHPKYLQTAFRESEGVTPGRWIEDYRIRTAQRTLLEGRTVGETARIVGYADARGLQRTFVRRLGCSPTAWLEGYRASSLPSASTTLPLAMAKTRQRRYGQK